METFKYNGLGIIKKLKIYDIKECYSSGEKGHLRFDGYMIVIKDGDNVYVTENFKDRGIKYEGCPWETRKLLGSLEIEFNPCDIKGIKKILKDKKSELESKIGLDSKFYSKVLQKCMLKDVNKLLDTFCYYCSN